jgi:hypothetical protein
VVNLIYFPENNLFRETCKIFTLYNQICIITFPKIAKVIF